MLFLVQAWQFLIQACANCDPRSPRSSHLRFFQMILVPKSSQTISRCIDFLLVPMLWGGWSFYHDADPDWSGRWIQGWSFHTAESRRFQGGRRSDSWGSLCIFCDILLCNYSYSTFTVIFQFQKGKQFLIPELKITPCCAKCPLSNCWEVRMRFLVP